MPRASNLLLLQELLCEPVTVSHLSLLAADRLSLLCRNLLRLVLQRRGSDIGVHSEPLEGLTPCQRVAPSRGHQARNVLHGESNLISSAGLRRPDTSCRQNVPLSPLVRRKSLVTKQA